MLSTVGETKTASGATLQNMAIFALASLFKCFSLLATAPSGWIPDARSIFTECCSGLVFCSPVVIVGTKARCMNTTSSPLKRIWRMASRTTSLSISPTVPPISTTMVVEIGGTVGDIESEVVLEAIRQMRFNGDEVVFIHLALVPTITTGEQKTKPLQHSVKMLLASGIQPDGAVARSEKHLNKEARAKIAMFCNVAPEAVFVSPTVDNIYKLPLVLEEQGIENLIAEKLSLKLKERDLGEWKELLDKKPKTEKTIAVVGKYATTRDTYMSVFEALQHASLNNDVKLNAVLIDSEKVEERKSSTIS